jgi:peptide/nickel transport system substrate-binding protein
MRVASQLLVLVVVLTLAATGCAAPPRESNDASSGVSAAPSAPATPKRIVTAIMSNPPYLYRNLAGTGIGPGQPGLEQMITVGLAVSDRDGRLRPQLAEAIPTVDNGQWRVFPDGRMETTWKIRSNAQWHDGTPFTSEDVLFTARLFQDTDLTLARLAAYNYVDRFEAPDPQTVTVHWKQPFIEADALFIVASLPKHILEKPYADDKATFHLQPYWTDDFVGTGPYRVHQWVKDSHLILQAHGGYALGRAKIDEIEVRLIPDENAFVANILAGNLDVSPGQSLSFEQGLQVRDLWSGGKVEIQLLTEMKLWPQFVNPTPAIVGDVRFRKALMYALNRQEMVETIMAGVSPIAHSIVQPTVPEHADVQEAAIKYDYDPRRAQQMIEGLGYVRGSDGLFRDTGGQLLSVNIQTTPEDHNLKPMYAAADYWQRVGVSSELDPIPPPRQRDIAYRANFPSFNLQMGAGGITRLKDLRSVDARLPENGYRGLNYSRYQSPEYDALLDRYLSTIPAGPRMDALRNVIRHMTDQLNIMTLYYNASPTMVSSRMVNVGPDPTWNAHEWDVSRQ